MKSYKTFLAVLILSALTACTVTGKSTSIKQVKEIKLNNGTVSRIGYRPVESNWGCTVLDKQSSNSGMNQFKGQFSFGGQFEVLEKNAIDYANKANLKPNYIFLYVPTEVEVGSLTSSALSKSSATYYDCKILPELKTSLF